MANEEFERNRALQAVQIKNERVVSILLFKKLNCLLLHFLKTFLNKNLLLLIYKEYYILFNYYFFYGGMTYSF